MMNSILINSCLVLFESTIVHFVTPASIETGVFPSFVIFSSLHLAISFLYKLILYPFFLSPLRHLPQPRGFRPFFGHLFTLLDRSAGAPHLRIMKNTPNDGIVHIFGIFHTDRLLLTSPAALADVLVHKSYDFEKPTRLRKVLRRLIGDGLLMIEGNQHKHHRKLLMPAFHFRRIKNFYRIFWAKSIELCSAAKTTMESTASHELDISHLCTQVTLDIMGLAGIGRDMGSLQNQENELVKNFEGFLEPTAEKSAYFRCHLIFPSWLVALLPWGMHQMIDKTAKNLRRICSELVSERKLEIMQHDHEDNDILSSLIKDSGLPNECLVDHVMTLFAAGHESTASAFTWAAHLLSINEGAQTRLREEIYNTILDPGELMEPDCQIATILETMPYLNSVCNEVLRLFPTIPISARVAIRDTTVAGQLVPAETLILIVPWAINRNPQLWGTDSEEFIPERWIDKDTGRTTMNGGAKSNYSFLTFFHGPRSCIGERFARAELRALITAFVGSFRMEMADPSEVVVVGGSLTTKPVNGMRLKLTPMAWGP